MTTPDQDTALSRSEISAAVTELGWRLVLGMARTRVRVASLAQAGQVVALAAAEAGPDGGSLRADARADQVILSLQRFAAGRMTRRETDLAARISAAVGGLGLATDAGAGPGRPVQVLEIAIDAMDIPAIRPFWQAVLGYADEPGTDPLRGLIDPAGQGPAFWFQQMDAPRPQRNRFHVDVSVPHDEAAGRIAATLAAGGTLRYDAEAPAFWVLADAEGNEACVTTWQGRD
jgi:4a-hydroxytetrahydrobiopterin dehydratase